MRGDRHVRHVTRATGHVFSPEHRGTMMCEGKTDSAMKSSGSGTFTATSRIMHLQGRLCYNVIHYCTVYSICSVDGSFIQNCVDIYIYLCKYDIPCIAAPGQPSAQIKNKKYLLRPKLFTGTTREVSLPPPPYPSIKTK